MMTLGENYYTQVGNKNIEAVKEFLHEDVEFVGPLANLKGRDAVVEATKNFMAMIGSLTIRAKFGNETQAMVVYDVSVPGIIDEYPGASLLTFQDGKIVRIQLFYDASVMQEKKEEIFS